MGIRRKARESALQVLYQLEFDEKPVEDALAQCWQGKEASSETREYGSWLVREILAHREEIDRVIQSNAEHWRISRMALVDRNILRLAVFELLYEKNLAPAIVINEAIEIAKKFSGQESSHFINGVLDAVRKKAVTAPGEVGENVRKKRERRKRKGE
jgi:N utilization substance protein B